MPVSRVGEGSQDFNAYVRNLHRAMRLRTAGSQLQMRPATEARGNMVMNPYSATIAEMNICDVRSAASSDGKRSRSQFVDPETY